MTIYKFEKHIYTHIAHILNLHVYDLIQYVHVLYVLYAIYVHPILLVDSRSEQDNIARLAHLRLDDPAAWLTRLKDHLFHEVLGGTVG